mgnify:CR=1 FL=1
MDDTFITIETQEMYNYAMWWDKYGYIKVWHGLTYCNLSNKPISVCVTNENLYQRLNKLQPQQ